MLDSSLLLFILGFPLLILAITIFTRYPLHSEIPNKEDRKEALIKFGADTGLDCYFMGAVAVISATVTRFGATIPLVFVFVMLGYGIFSVVVTRLYKVAWKNLNNFCLFVGIASLVFAGGYASVVILA